MGIEVGTAALIGAGVAAAGAGHSAVRAEHHAKKNREQYREQRAENAIQSERIQNEQNRANDALKASKKKLAVGMGRSFAARSASALFREQQSANNPSGSTLG